MNHTRVIDLVSAPADTMRPDVEGDAVRKWVNAINGWTDWMGASGSSPATLATRRYQIGRLAEAQLRRSPWRVSTNDLAGWLASHDWAPATLSTYRSALRKFYGWAQTTGQTRRNPAADLPTVRVPDGLPRPAPVHVVAAALDRANDRTRLILLLAAYGGLRRAEITALRWDHVSDTHLRIRGKGGKVRPIPLRRELAAALAAERDRRFLGAPGTGHRYSAGQSDDGGWVFPGRLRGHLAPAVIGRIATDALGSGWSTHTLRHSFGTRAYAGSHDLRAVQQLLGHASPATTRIYTQIDDDALRAAVNAI